MCVYLTIQETSDLAELIVQLNFPSRYRYSFSGATSYRDTLFKSLLLNKRLMSLLEHSSTEAAFLLGGQLSGIYCVSVSEFYKINFLNYKKCDLFSI